MNTTLPAKWFRMYAEFATDPKVQMLSEQDQRRYIMLLCLRCSNGDVALHDEELAFQLRISNEEWLSTKQVLLSKCLITKDSKPAAWDRRQFASDSSTARVARHREAKKPACSVTVTAPETEVETETEKEKTPAQGDRAAVRNDGFAEFWLTYPRKKNKGDAEKAWRALKPSTELSETILRAVATAKLTPDWTKEGGQFIPYPASWLRAKGYEDSPDAITYSADAVAVIGLYNETLAPRGWPEAVLDPYSAKRAGDIALFLAMDLKEGWVRRYFDWMASNVQPMNGYGFDRVIAKETVVRAREGNFKSFGVAA